MPAISARGNSSGLEGGGKLSLVAVTAGRILLPILKEKFGVPSVLGIVSAVSLMGLAVTLIFGREDTE